MDGSPSLKLQDSKPGGARGMFEKHQKPKLLQGSQLKGTRRVFMKHSKNVVRGEMVEAILREEENLDGMETERSLYQVPTIEEPNACARRRRTFESGGYLAGTGGDYHGQLGLSKPTSMRERWWIHLEANESARTAQLQRQTVGGSSFVDERQHQE
ncbi:hypothetical protein Dimus_020087 [Dionaea muscipula]